MSIESKIVRGIIGLLWRHYRYLVMDVVCGPDRHIHYNPAKKPKDAANA